MADPFPVLWWVRRDLRLADNPALSAAVATGRPVIPVYLHDETTQALGAAPRWRLGLGIATFSKTLEEHGARLILRRGRALACLSDLIRETGAGAVFWSRLLDPASVARDIEVKAALKAAGVTAQSFAGHLLFEPWEVRTGTGGPYRVFTPYWRAVRGRPVAAPLPPPRTLAAPARWPASEDLAAWDMGRAMNRGALVVAAHVCVGEERARDRLARFAADRLGAYDRARDLPAVAGTSKLSENLTYGEISPNACWHAGWAALQQGGTGAETFLRELVWREFAHHLTFHTPWIVESCWKPDWDGFGWNLDAAHPEVQAWQQGRTGMPMVDAAMRELYVTGVMHNRTRMVAASYLTKHLLSHWRLGQAWFADCLIDWDPASNAMGWQWVAGSGPDAAPYFRILNPETQRERFDPDQTYCHRWIAEGRAVPSPEALSYFDAIPRRWGLTPQAAYPDPVVTAAAGRKRALMALEAYGLRGAPGAAG